MSHNAQIVSDFVDYATNVQNRSKDTVYKYALSLRSLALDLDQAGVTLEGATAADLRAWVYTPLKNGGAPSPATVKRKVAELRSLWNWMIDVAELTRVNPARKLHVPTVHNEEPKPVPDEDWRAVWFSDLSTADRVAFGLAYFCGLRRHEVTLLAAWNFTQVPHPRIANFKRKGGKKMTLPYVSCATFFEQRRPDLIGDADTFLGPLACLLEERAADVALLPWRDEQRAAPLYVRRPMPAGFINPGYFNKQLVAACDAAGAARFSPHQMRHSFGTNTLAMGMPLLQVSRLMGHSSVTITQRYIQTSEDPFVALLAAAPRDDVTIPSPYG
jgi:integrase/recombinase XerC